MKVRLGLVGRGIEHSRSQDVYQKLLGHTIDYSLFDYSTEGEIPPLDELFNQVQGLSITAPYKPHFLGNVNTDEIAKKFGGVNCIKRDGDKFYGTITDHPAVSKLINDLIKEYNSLYAIILGDGVMSKMTQSILEESGQLYHVLARRKGDDLNQINFKHYEELHSKSQLIIINTCSRQFVFNGQGHQKALFWDFNYAMDEHSKTLPAKFQKYTDGEEMLFQQGYFALKFWKIT